MTPEQSQDIKTALDTIKARAPERQLYIDYYDGRHPLAFATEKFHTTFGEQLKRLRDNLCPIVVDAVADRMEVINFGGDDEDANKAVATKAWELWQREQMELYSYDTHVEALKTGAAYLIVWGDETNKAKFYLQDSRNCVVIEDEETAMPLFGAKKWMTQDKMVRLTLYYADRIEKWVTIKKPAAGLPLKPEHFTEYSSDTENAREDNPYGVIPMFKFETPPVLNNCIPIQDMLNKTVADTMVAMEFAAFRQRWATGLEPPIDQVTGIPTLPFKAGTDKLWFTNDKETKFGDFEATDLIPFNATADKFRLEMALTSGTPVHFFSVNTSDAISGEALKTLESRFTKKTTRMTLNFGAVWGQVMKLALQIERASVSENVTPQWAPTEQKSEKEGLDNAVLKQSLGIPLKTLWEELGYGKEQIAEFEKAKEEAAKKLAEDMTPPPQPPPTLKAVA